MQVRCYCDLYVSSGLKSKKNQVILELMERKSQNYSYVVTLAQNEQNHLEFFPASILLQKYYNEERLFVVGLAESYQAAQYLIARIVQDVINQTGGTDIRGYIIACQNAFEESRG